MKISTRIPLLFAGAGLLAMASAQGKSTDTGVPDISSLVQSASSAEATATNSKTASTKSANTASTTEAKTGTSIQTTTAHITGGSSGVLTGAAPTITGSGQTGISNAIPSDLPTIAGAFTIAAPSVPPTAGAPYMQVSHLPEGTVFIVVGAILGFMAMCVLLWRGLVAWSLHRSVKRASRLQDMSDTKALFRTPAAPMYSQYKDRESTISLGGLGGKGGKKGRPSTATQAGAGNSSLFFSPTAGAASVSGILNPGNRGSNYLPAGYYAAGASQPGNGQGMAHIGHGGSISLSNLGPVRGDGYARARSIGPSPPGSPRFTGEGARGPYNGAAGMSSSSLNLTQHENVRAPSAYLEDLFDSEGGPPVPQPGPGMRDDSPYRDGSPRRF